MADLQTDFPVLWFKVQHKITKELYIKFNLFGNSAQSYDRRIY